MSARFPSTGNRRKEYESGQRNLSLQNVTRTPSAFHNVLKASLPLSDESEFPSLSETSRTVPHHSHTGEKSSKYSDKLKVHSPAQNQSSVFSFIHLKNNPGMTDSYTSFQNGKKHSFNENDSFQTQQRESNESNFANSKFLNSSHNFPKGQSNISPRVSHSSKYNENKYHSHKQKHIDNSSNSLSHSTHKAALTKSVCSSHNSKSNNQTESRNEQKVVIENSPVNKSNDDSLNTTAKKKKKRKSKVKRQVALQTGKITVLTAEVHSKILNQTSALTTPNFKSVLTDINDEKEYPELGKALVPASQKENYPKKETSFSQSIHQAVDKSTDTSRDTEYSAKDISVNVTDSVIITTSKPDGSLAVEKVGKNENKAVHPNDPITVSFYDILVNRNFKTKVKAFKLEDDTSPTIGLATAKVKKNSCHPHNCLDSSAPTIKRGKEREKPKPKKPSHLKKIILLDRKVRKEQLLHLKNSSYERENAVTVNEYEQVSETEKIEVDSSNRSILLAKNCENSSLDTLLFQLELQENDLLQLEDCGLCLPDYPEFSSKMENILMNKTQESDLTLDTVSSVIKPVEDMEIKPFSDGASRNDHLDKISIDKDICVVQSEVVTDSSLVEKSNMNVSRSDDLLLDSLKDHDKNLNSSDREKAVKVLLHTRNFREYCNHLISKDIDDVVHALLDDLARFQDRLHQKDPVKARMKRRMIYGVKEVKKHIKLKKLKSIVIAADIENVEAQGGLNDFLDDIKSSASDHHIPCVFALSRKVLGKICHKPVPISCVGIFNYEGSEVNFKKMIELQTQSKTDYMEICSKLSESLTEDQISSLLKAKKEAPEALSTIRRNILGDFFGASKDTVVNQEKADFKSEKALSDINV